ncbi:MAG: hypothetical protein SFX18_06755 [Pirellulales bacterium]|nr:hypothetical protein [Pirellulales bacterium]
MEFFAFCTAVFFSAFIYAGFCALLSWVGGWWQLGNLYPATIKESGSEFWMISGSFGWPPFAASYGRCLFVTVTSRGLRISIFFLFRPFHPPLFFPWERVLRGDFHYELFYRALSIELVDYHTPIVLYGRAAQPIADAFSQWQCDRQTEEELAEL